MSRTRARILAGSLAFAAFQFLFTVAFAPFAVLCGVLPYRRRFGVISQWARVNLWMLERCCGLRAEVRGLENIPREAAIVLCKHQSAWETLALQRWFRPQVWVLKRELLWIPFFGWGLAMLRPIAIDRRSRRRAVDQIIAQGRQRLEDGCFVVIFPEGTRVPPGQRGRYKLGGAILAQHTGRDVVPVAHDAGHYWPRKSFLKYPGCIRVVIGPPIRSAGRDAAEVNRLAENWIEETVAALGGAATDRPPDAR